MFYSYLRVSTDKQTIENQRFEVIQYCNKKGIVIDNFITETISGKTQINNRNLGKLIKKLKQGDTLIVTELSRLGRSLLDVMETLNYCMKRQISIYSIKENFELCDNINSKVLAFAFSLSAEIERQLISQRTKEALARKKAEGVILGRKMGTRNVKYNAKCTKNHDLILKHLESGISVPNIAKDIKVARGTLYRYLAYTQIKNPRHTKRKTFLERGVY